MSTTTVRLNEVLKNRVARMAKLANTTSHHFILEAVAEKTAQAEREEAISLLAQSRHQAMLATGDVVEWADMKEFAQAIGVRSPESKAIKRPKTINLHQK